MQFWQEKGKIYFLSRTHGYYRINETPKGYTYDSLGKNLTQLHFIKLSHEKLYAISEGEKTTGAIGGRPVKFIKSCFNIEQLLFNIVSFAHA